MNAKNTTPIQIISNSKKFNQNKKEPTKEQLSLLDIILNDFEENKTYKNAQLSLNQLALTLEVKPRLLSSTINTCLHQNFYDFINSYRIEEAKKIIQLNNDTKQTIAEVMYSVGYNSKSSFNTSFKKFTGHTPSFFRKKK